MRYRSAFYGFPIGTVFKKYRLAVCKAVVCCCFCLCLSGDAYAEKSIFEHWVRPPEEIDETQTEVISETESILETESFDRPNETEKNDETNETDDAETAENCVGREAGLCLSLGDKQSFEGEARELYPLYLTAHEDFAGLLWRVSVTGGEIYAVIDEGKSETEEFFYLIEGHQAAMMLVGDIAADEKQRLICYISVVRNENAASVPKIILLDYVKKEKSY